MIITTKVGQHIFNIFHFFLEYCSKKFLKIFVSSFMQELIANNITQHVKDLYSEF